MGIKFMKQFFKSLFTATKGSISSKRVCGVFGFFSILGMVLYCIVTSKEAPVLASEMLYTSAALLGIDSVAKCFNRNKDE